MSKKRIFLFILVVIIFLIIISILGIKFTYNEPKVTVLCYHDVIPEEDIGSEGSEKNWTISVECFEQQMKFLSDFNFKTLTLDEFYKWKKGELEVPFNSVLVTFDDGLLSNYKYAFPILKKYNINATEFIIGKFSDKEVTEEENGQFQIYMGRDLIKKSKEEFPTVEFASHTYNMHIVGKLKNMSKEDIEADFKEMNNFQSVEYVAYPFGAYNNDFIDVLKNNNVKLAFTLSDNKKATRNDSDFIVNRVNVSKDIPLYKFALRFLLPY